MSKYNFTLDLNDKSSHSYILKSIRPNTTVLEFGAANGIMTKYMEEELNCKVYIVEIDEEDGKEASKYAFKSLIGKDKGNIENYIWAKEFKNIKFDHIIFADILEHLYWPSTVLKESAKLLGDDSSILISIPNVGHNAILIDLVNGKFDYRETGLLDKTHIRFFTQSSLQQMIDEAGLKIFNEMNTVLPVGNTEFNNSWSDVNEQTAQCLKSRKDGDIYQFVWQLIKK